MAENFYKAVYNLVKQIPRGQVATYGQVAAILGKPQGARLVGWALRLCPPNVPWQRVINQQGMISIIHPRLSGTQQALLLRREGIKVTKRDNNYFINLKTYQWPTN